MVSVDNVYKSYGRKKVLNGANLQIKQGEIVGIVGANGAGKTTLIKLISKLIYPTKGEIELNDHSVAALVEQPAFFLDLTGRENLEYFLDKKVTTEVIENAPFGCEEFINLSVRKYSMGMRQKLALWMVFLAESDYILLDEPSVSLDINAVEELDKLLVEKKKDRGILIASHNFSELQQVCDRVVVLKEGICQDEIKLEVDNKDAYVIKILNSHDKKIIDVLKKEKIIVTDGVIEFRGTEKEVALFMKKLIQLGVGVCEVFKKHAFLQLQYEKIIGEKSKL